MSRGRSSEAEGATLVPWVVAGVVMSACGDGDHMLEYGSANPFSNTTTSIALEVDYIEGAEPYTGELGRSIDIWDITRANIAALFPHAIVDVPSELWEMEPIAPTGKGSYTTDDIVGIARKHWGRRNSDGTAHFYVVWLDGWYEQEDEISTSVLGVALSGAPILAMFKPVIMAADLPGRGAISEFVEQSTLVHEFGHAIGLVNLGISSVTRHHDEHHNGHCQNPRCVMFHLNEGPLDLRDFVLSLMATGEMVLFDEACRADVAAAAGAARN